MNTLVAILLIVGGLALLVKCADIFIDGSSHIAKRLNVSERLIGLTLVAFGTSFPELSISVIAAINGSEGMAVGNVVGSNIFNICGVLGIMAIMKPVVVEKTMLKKDIPMGILTTFVLFILLFDTIFAGDTVNRLTRSDALIFLLFFAVFLYYTFYSQINGEPRKIQELRQIAHSKVVPHHLWKNIAMIVFGLAGVLIGGELVVKGGVKIAEIFGMSHTLIGLTIVAIGTSLPELTTGVVAVLKGKQDIAVGNIVGSSVFNILFILGTTAVIAPITMSVNILIDIIVMIAVTVFLFFTARSNGNISRREGIFFVLAYIVYLVYIIHRG